MTGLATSHRLVDTSRAHPSRGGVLASHNAGWRGRVGTVIFAFGFGPLTQSSCATDRATGSPIGAISVEVR